MPKIYSATTPIEAPLLDAFCALQKGFTDQFVYYRKDTPVRFMGLGRCIAVRSLADVESVIQGEVAQEPVMFSFNRFDAGNPKPADEMMQAFPKLGLLVPEVVLMENEQGCFLQVNSLGPVYQGRVARFIKHIGDARKPERRTIPYELVRDSFADWEQMLNRTLGFIREGRVPKLVPSRRIKLEAATPYSSKDLLVNLIEGPAAGTVFMYRYGDVFFVGCTPELLIRKKGSTVESMCLAGTIAKGSTPEETAANAAALLADDKNRREHEFVVEFMRAVFARNCFDVDIPAEPNILPLQHVQHLHTPVRAKVMEGKTLLSLASQLHPTPALSGTPVGEALMCLREVEGYNRGFFGGSIGYVDAAGDGEFSVAIRSGVFDGEAGWLYAGCGIVEGSDAASEFDEIDLKLKTILNAFEGGE